MPKLFGVDIAKEIGKAMGPGFPSGKLFKVTSGTRTTGELAGGDNPAEKASTFRGFLDDYDVSQVDGTTVQRGDRKVLILGYTITPVVVPEQGYRIEIEGLSLEVVRVQRDPAAATYLCQVRG